MHIIKERCWRREIRVNDAKVSFLFFHLLVGTLTSKETVGKAQWERGPFFISSHELATSFIFYLLLYNFHSFSRYVVYQLTRMSVFFYLPFKYWCIAIEKCDGRGPRYKKKIINAEGRRKKKTIKPMRLLDLPFVSLYFPARGMCCTFWMTCLMSLGACSRLFDCLPVPY